MNFGRLPSKKRVQSRDIMSGGRGGKELMS